jgi:hypothetical protein
MFIYIHILRDLSLMVKFWTFNLCNVGSNPIDLTHFSGIYPLTFLTMYKLFI